METISFARGAPSPDLLPLEELADCAEAVLAREGKTILSYGAGAGYTPLRELIPTFQNPTGTTLTAERREKLAEFSRRRTVPIVEDDPYSLVRFEGEPLPALFDYSEKTSIYMSSFSKTVAPGLRVGFMILPERGA